jgi:hypothetical protein
MTGVPTPDEPTPGVPVPEDPVPEEATVPAADAAAFAPSLVGLGSDDAVRLATEAGFDPQVVPPGVTAVTLEFRPLRIRLYVDEAGSVTRATAG